MKTSFTHLAFVSLIIALWTPGAHALFRIMDRPGLAFPQEMPASTRKAVTKALNHPDATFVGGRLLNDQTSLRYQGSAAALTNLLADLAAIPESTIHLTFVESFPEEGDWLLTHSARENQGLTFTFTVRLQSENLALSELKLPPIQGPAPAEGQRPSSGAGSEANTR